MFNGKKKKIEELEEIVAMQRVMLYRAHKLLERADNEIDLLKTLLHYHRLGGNSRTDELIKGMKGDKDVRQKSKED